jgi:hypothetical protein
MLQHQTRIDQVEAGVREDPEVRTGVMQERAAGLASHQAFGRVQHGYGDVDSGDGVEIAAQGGGEAPDATAEVKRRGPQLADPKLAQAVERSGDLSLAGGHELADIPPPAAPVRVNADCPERIGESQLGPVAGEPGQHAMPRSHSPTSRPAAHQA